MPRSASLVRNFELGSKNVYFPLVGPDVRRKGGTAFLDVIFHSIRERFVVEAGRRAIVVRSDGGDNSCGFTLLDAIETGQATLEERCQRIVEDLRSSCELGCNSNNRRQPMAQGGRLQGHVAFVGFLLESGDGTTPAEAANGKTYQSAILRQPVKPFWPVDSVFGATL